MSVTSGGPEGGSGRRRRRVTAAAGLPPAVRLFNYSTLCCFPPCRMRVWAVSDIHTDYADNLEWLRQLTSSDGSAVGGGAASGGGSSDAGSFKQDALLLAGDISDSLETLTKTLEMCVAAFGHVFFTPGNHGAPRRRGGLPACGRPAGRPGEEGGSQLCPECRCGLRPAGCLAGGT